MKLSPQEEATVKTYDAIAKEWSQQHTSRDFYRGEIAKFKQLLPTGKILEIGVGNGRDAMELRAAGYEYVGVDVSAKLLEIARQHNPGATFLQQSVYQLEFEEKSFDGFWAAEVLLHIPKDRIDSALSRIHAVVKDEGIGFISMHEGEGEEIKSNEKGEQNFAYYTLTEFAKILNRNRFDIIESHIRPEDSSRTWLYYFVKVRK